MVYLPGGYGGIGEAIAWGLAQRGAKIVVSGRSAEKAKAFACALRNAGHEAGGLTLDVTSIAPIGSSVDQVVERHGAIDILMNCVGIQRDEPVLEVTEAAYDDVYRVNLKAAMFVAQAAAKHQIAAGRGAVLLFPGLGLRDRPNALRRRRHHRQSVTTRGRGWALSR